MVSTEAIASTAPKTQKKHAFELIVAHTVSIIPDLTVVITQTSNQPSLCFQCLYEQIGPIGDDSVDSPIGQTDHRCFLVNGPGE